MAKGKYASVTPKRRRRRRRTPTGLIITILLLITVLALGGTLMLHACRPEEVPETQPMPEVTLPEAAPPVEEGSRPIATVPATEPPLEEAPETTTAETTEPTEETIETTAEPTEKPTKATEATTEPTKAPTDEEKAKGAEIAELALAQVGKPYALGSEGPDDFDTSGLVKYCIKEVTGTSLPHSVSTQAKKGDRVNKKDLLPGDAVFFWTSDPDSVEYVGIYVGGNKFVAARSQDKPVSEMSMKVDYFKERYLFACRYW